MRQIKWTGGSSFCFLFFAGTNDRQLINQLAYDPCILASYIIEGRLLTLYSTHVYIEYAILGEKYILDSRIRRVCNFRRKKNTWMPYIQAVRHDEPS